MPDTRHGAFRALTGGAAPRIKVVDIGANPIDSAPPYAAMLRAGDAEAVGFEPNRTALAALDRPKGGLRTLLPRGLSVTAAGTRCTSARRRA